MNKEAEEQQAEVRNKSLVQKNARIVQIEEKNARLAREQEEKVAGEKWYFPFCIHYLFQVNNIFAYRVMQRSRLLVEEENRDIAALKEKKRLQMEEMKLENDKCKARKAQAKLNQCEYEVKLNKEFE